MSEYNLRASIKIPSIVHSYSLGVDYMTKWFLKRFKKDFFKNIHIDGKHILDDYRNFDITKKIKVLKPNLSIVPTFDIEYDRNKVDSYPFGIDNYVKMSKKEQAFFKDTDKNIYLGIGLECMKINFVYRARFQTKAQQIDVAKFMKLAYRVGYSQSEDVTMDYHIPYEIILQLASDSGFEFDENKKILNPIGFLSYLNSHSLIPVIFKFRAINGKMEFFLRFREQYMRIYCPGDLQIDEGDRVGMLQDNFIIEMNAELQMPSPKMYMYYSSNDHNELSGFEESNGGVGLYTIKVPDVPEKNNLGWDLLLNTQYSSTELKGPIQINFKELFIGDNDLTNAIKYNQSIKISPSTFIDFKLFNGGYQIDYKINWDTMIIIVDKDVTDYNIDIFIYVDIKYINEQIISSTELNKSEY